MGSTAGADDVTAFMAALDHPLKREIEALRSIILGADPRVAEHIKWNAPSFHIQDDFATFQLRRPDAVQIVFHTGAKPPPGGPNAMKVDDPAGLLKWAAIDRAVSTFEDMDQIGRRGAALTAIVQAWIARL